MTNFANLQADALSVDGFANQNGLIPTRYGGNKKSWQYLVDQFEAEFAEQLLEINKSRGYRVVGTFAAGFEYELFNDVGIDASGNSWIYVGDGAPVATVAPGTDPSLSADYQQVTFNSIDGVVGLRDELNDRALYLTLAQAQASDLKVGQYVRLTDRDNPLYKVQPVGLVANGMDVVGLPNGTSLEYVRGQGDNAVHIGAVGDGVFDNTDVLTRAVDIFRNTYLPDGTYAIESVIRKSGPNPIQRQITGQSQDGTVIKALPSLTNSALVWFGNSTGYGVQYTHIKNLTIDGTDKAQNCTGILYQSCGLSSVKNVTFRNLGRTFWGLGCIDTHLIDCDHFNYTQGPYWTVYAQGETNGDLDDLNNQQTQTTNANSSSMVRNWISSGDLTATYISGAQFRLDGCLYQSATNDDTQTNDLIVIENSNEAYDYGAGPIIEGCWTEGGKYRFACSIINTRQTRLFKNIFNGAFNNTDKLFEGGVHADANSVENLVAKYNTFRGYFDSPPTEGRSGNGCIYLQNSNTNYTADVKDNYITYNTTNIYWEGMNNPAVDRSPLNMFATISGLTTTPSVDFASSNFISSVVVNGTGDITFIYSFNRQALPDGGFYPVMLTCHTSGGAVTYPAGHLVSNANSDRFIFNDDSGSPATPVGVTIHLLGGGWV
ncbi:hypothetical protein TW1_019 [Pseudoalteromonas phage TW1]|uniref:hypothetical protein n=1 Tax=Pseudoalteromonas phage TW1 TaxID=1366055 RepID=UPI00035AB723|nr:hypothetical protein PP585_gp19 [Pseudoalteromonas phage TW1]AGR46535.1 hypothetical protein TW1_019 [Pseudoalteromonas phage TW1]